jgi:hypothetical protein
MNQKKRTREEEEEGKGGETPVIYLDVTELLLLLLA